MIDPRDFGIYVEATLQDSDIVRNRWVFSHGQADSMRGCTYKRVRVSYLKTVDLGLLRYLCDDVLRPGLVTPEEGGIEHTQKDEWIERSSPPAVSFVKRDEASPALFVTIDSLRKFAKECEDRGLEIASKERDGYKEQLEMERSETAELRDLVKRLENTRDELNEANGDRVRENVALGAKLAEVKDMHERCKTALVMQAKKPCKCCGFREQS